MSSISFGKTVEQSALELLGPFLDPANRDKMVDLKKTLAAIVAEQQKNAQRLADAKEAEKRAEDHSVISAKALADAQAVNSDTEDRRAAIARRQDEWERNLNVRETELKNGEATHAAEIARFETYKTAQSNDIERRSLALGQRERDYEKRKAALDQREAELNEQVAAAEALVARFKK